MHDWRLRERYIPVTAQYLFVFDVDDRLTSQASISRQSSEKDERCSSSAVNDRIGWDLTIKRDNNATPTALLLLRGQEPADDVTRTALPSPAYDVSERALK